MQEHEEAPARCPSRFENGAMGSLRTAIDAAGRPVFCLRDACAILGIRNASDSRKRLKPSGVVTIKAKDGAGRGNSFLYVTEGNLYRLAFQSRKEGAEAFVDWVTEDVLPQIRRFGRYQVDQVMASAESAAALIEDYSESQARMAVMRHAWKECRGAREYVKRALDSYALRDLCDVAAFLGIDGIATADILKVLRANGVLDDRNMPYQEYVDRGWFRVDTHSYQDRLAGTVTHVRVFCYAAAVNAIRRMLDRLAGGGSDA